MDHNQLVSIAPMLVFFIAVIYSSVGHGGASSYLAVMSLLAVSPAEMSSKALVLNIFVAGIAFIAFARAGHFDLKLALPIIIASVPAAFMGGLVQLNDRVYFVMLSIALIAAALRLCMNTPRTKESETKPLNIPTAASAGAGIGLISGIVGIGGGIFLSPLMILMKWADPKKTAAVSACFIVVNSIAGLGGRLARGAFHATIFDPLLLTALAGGLIGSKLGSSSFSGRTLRIILATVLLFAAGKMVLFSH